MAEIENEEEVVCPDSKCANCGGLMAIHAYVTLVCENGCKSVNCSGEEGKLYRRAYPRLVVESPLITREIKRWREKQM